MGAKIDTRQLDIADFVLSDRIAVERKTAEDFIDSLVDGRLFDQLKRLKEYPRPFMILEGDGLSTGRNVSPEAIMGAVASITVDYGVPILQTRTPEETARFLLAVAKREQGRAGRHVGVRSAPATANDDDVSLAILGGIPGVSQVRAQTLLLAFGSVGGVLAASETDLASVDGVGPKIAHNIRHALRHLYGSPPPESF
jgi:ERCC4-type nuclease